MKTSQQLAVVVTMFALAALADRAQAQAPTEAKGTVYHDRNANGTRDEGEPGLPDIAVSNQKEVVRTDKDGRWTLPCDDDTTFFVIKPRGWITPVDRERMLPRFYYTHKPAGSPRQKFPGVAPTGPLPASIDFALVPQEEPDKFQVVLFGDTQPRNDKEIEYMAHDVVPELLGTKAAFGATLGDVVFDDLSVFDHHNRVVALIGIPWYNVLGNHDVNYDAPDDHHADETFEAHFGPNYYAFDHGPTHFIVLDDVAWVGEKDGKKGNYHAELGATQLEFVRNDLALVAEDRLVVLMMHIPLWEVSDRQQLYRLIEKRPYSLSIAAHTHSQVHRFISKEDGWMGAEPHHHFVNVTVCGSWWSGMPNEFGVPHATTRDGVPNGYSVITFDGRNASIVYKAAGRPADYQMNIFAPYELTADAAGGAEILANVFAGTEKSTVEMRFGDKGEWTKMEKVTRPDPYIEQIVKQEDESPKFPGLKIGKAIDCTHLWSGKLPPNPRAGVTMIHVRTTDMYGQTYFASRVIRIR